MDRERNALCGFQPSLGAAVAQAAPTPLPRPAAPEITISAAPVAAAPARVTQPPIRTVASVTTPPRVNAAPRPAAPTPQVISVPAARTMTRAQICDGKTGVQPGYISSRTGQPLDCGPGQVVAAAVAAPVAQAAPAARSQRISMAEICADISATGRRYVNGRTGAEVRCGPQTEPVSSGRRVVQQPSVAPMQVAIPSAPVVVANGRVATSCAGASPYLTSGNRDDVRCGPQSQSPSGVTRAVPVTTAMAAPAAAPQGLFRRPPPYSNPVVAAAPQPTPGYAPVWDDGRLNPNRGLPGAQTAKAATETATAVQQVATAHRYVQVGTYANPGNADAAAQRLAAMGLSARMGTVTRSNGQVLKVVVAGPFASSQDLSGALQVVRRNGFSDAFTRQ